MSTVSLLVLRVPADRSGVRRRGGARPAREPGIDDGRPRQSLLRRRVPNEARELVDRKAPDHDAAGRLPGIIRADECPRDRRRTGLPYLLGVGRHRLGAGPVSRGAHHGVEDVAIRRAGVCDRPAAHLHDLAAAQHVGSGLRAEIENGLRRSVQRARRERSAVADRVEGGHLRVLLSSLNRLKVQNYLPGLLD